MKKFPIILEQNYPNPFNPVTAISYYIPEEAAVELKIHNIIGKEIATLVNGRKPAGYYQVEWDATEMPSGVYFYSLRAVPANNEKVFYEVKKMILLR